MQTIDVTETIPMPIEAAFELLVDHANYKRFPGVVDSELLQPGTAEPNGKGALRRISLGDVVLDEEITAFERPQRMDYRIVKSKPIRVDHQGGSIRLETVPEGTRIHWTSTMRLRIPLVGWFITRRAVQQFDKGFRALLRALPEAA
ncbi:MAG: SRPBCC family protein [Pseudomonadota bacterium]